MLANYLFWALAGTTWYFQFFFYTMGETQMGSYRFSSWTLHMASIIIFSTLWGIALKEWKGAGVADQAACGVQPVGSGGLNSNCRLRKLHRRVFTLTLSNCGSPQTAPVGKCCVQLSRARANPPRRMASRACSRRY